MKILRVPRFLPATRGPRWSFAPAGLVAVLVVVLSAALTLPADVRAAEEDRTGTSQLVTGASCFILTPVYGAFKLAFAGAGAIVGGMTWVFTGGDQEAAQKVWDASLRGTYIISPDHLSGEKPVEFVGQPAEKAQATPRRAR